MTDLPHNRIDDVRIARLRPVLPPAILIEQLPLSADAESFVYSARREVSAILHGLDDRLLVVVGPCSIHDVDAARAYAERLAAVERKLSDALLLVMRVYFEKPRTRVGWKGLINDPHLDGSFRINEGLTLARGCWWGSPTSGCAPAASSSTPSPPSSSPTPSPGERSALAPPRARSTASSPRVSPCRW